MSHISKMDITLDCGCLGDQEFTIEYEYTYQRETGISGPPENYDPGTEECDILEAMVIIGGKLLKVDINPTTKEQDEIMQLARNNYESFREESRESHICSLYNEVD